MQNHTYEKMAANLQGLELDIAQSLLVGGLKVIHKRRLHSILIEAASQRITMRCMASGMWRKPDVLHLFSGETNDLVLALAAVRAHNVKPLDGLQTHHIISPVVITQA